MDITIILSVGSFLAILATLARLPGFVAANDAIPTGTEKFQALQRMEALGVERLPAVDETQRFVGMVERSRLTASLLIDVTKSLQK